VIDVVEGSPGDEAGLVKGDVIVLVDGVPARELGLENIRRTFRRKTGTVVNLGVENGGERREARLTLRRVI
jgi:carboxyl-terminal processing protease